RGASVGVIVTELEALMKKVESTFGAVDETIIIVLKGHLLIEELLDRIIGTFVFHPDYVMAANLRFAQKISLARSLSVGEQDNAMWDIIIRLNALRNELAHSLGSDKRDRKVKAVVDCYLDQAEGHLDKIGVVKDQPEHIMLAFAVTFALGFLASFSDEANSFRRFIDASTR
ncbi:hypothetical protein, partial [Rhodobacter sp. NSM]|uniref:hypothetical protein n=1 Tax=Rhodobacter sp. NSM TaxID=3457501 RepID=UPI003FD36770